MLHVNPKLYSSLSRLLEIQLAVWPDHDRFLATRFETADLAFAEELAGLVLRVTDDPAKLAADYKWLCEQLYEEELYFRRVGTYRLSKFEDALREVYSNHEFMARYMNGVLLSHVWWDNHARVIQYYAQSFLAQNRSGYAHLEVGPGHGLLLHFAANDPRCAAATGWDVSETSIGATCEALARTGCTRDVRLVQRNIFDATVGDERFDSIVLSEVAEHLEDPKAALVGLRDHLVSGGRLFVNVPVNSPAPDHIYLFNTPEEGVDLVRDAGYAIAETRFFPMTGNSEERARKMKATISCVVVGVAP
jgi:2-polyprenyl-3-methyl-5-hydroxy-6-metoxy-1,4-benzoquinol methylase